MSSRSTRCRRKSRKMYPGLLPENTHRHDMRRACTLMTSCSEECRMSLLMLKLFPGGSVLMGPPPALISHLQAAAVRALELLVLR